jgi:hypothetical protein
MITACQGHWETPSVCHVMLYWFRWLGRAFTEKKKILKILAIYALICDCNDHRFYFFTRRISFTAGSDWFSGSMEKATVEVPVNRAGLIHSEFLDPFRRHTLSAWLP